MRYHSDVVQKDMQNILEQGVPFDKLRDKKILITGANGMLATYLVYFFMYLNETRGFNIKVYALVRNGKKANDRFGELLGENNLSLIVQDVCDELEIENEVDFIVHAAGNASPQFIINDPVGIIKANTIGTMNIMEFARKMPGVRVLYTSTREVYGKMYQDIDKITEEDFGILNPVERRACYPESKRMSETILQGYLHQHGIDSVIVRIAHSYGPGMMIENDGRVMADFISDVVHNRNIVMKSEGNAVRAFCYITDAVAGMILAMLEGKSGEAYNIANETEPEAIRDVAQQLVSAFPEKNLKVVFDIPKEMSVGYSKMGRTALDTKKMEALGWKPSIPLAEGMKRTVQSFME